MDNTVLICDINVE